MWEPKLVKHTSGYCSAPDHQLAGPDHELPAADCHSDQLIEVSMNTIRIVHL